MTEWVKCSERLPDHNQECIVAKGRGMAIGICDISNESYVFVTQDRKHQLFGITHWMPAPEAPND